MKRFCNNIPLLHRWFKILRGRYIKTKINIAVVILTIKTFLNQVKEYSHAWFATLASRMNRVINLILGKKQSVEHINADNSSKYSELCTHSFELREVKCCQVIKNRLLEEKPKTDWKIKQLMATGLKRYSECLEKERTVLQELREFYLLQLHAYSRKMKVLIRDYHQQTVIFAFNSTLVFLNSRFFLFPVPLRAFENTFEEDFFESRCSRKTRFTDFEKSIRPTSDCRAVQISACVRRADVATLNSEFLLQDMRIVLYNGMKNQAMNFAAIQEQHNVVLHKDNVGLRRRSVTCMGMSDMLKRVILKSTAPFGSELFVWSYIQHQNLRSIIKFV